MKAIIGSLLLAAIATPTMAAEFFIVQDTNTHHCTIVDKRPAEKTMTIVGDNGKTFTTREEANTAMKTVKVCGSTEGRDIR
jgi:hypothetical protein